MNCSGFWLEKNNNCSASNKKLDEDNYKKDRTICKTCYNEKKRRIKNIDTIIQDQRPKTDNVNKT